MKNKFILFGLIFMTLFSSFVYADIIMPGTKSVSWCYEISNINEYPNYVFLLNEERVSGPRIIKEGDCLGFYKNGLAKVYAIKKDNFNENELNRAFFSENNTNLIESNLQLGPYGHIDENNPLKEIVTTLKIISLDDGTLEIQKSKITYTYNDGTSEEKTFQNQDKTPEPSKKELFKSWFKWLLLALFLTIIIEFFIVWLFIRKTPLKNLGYVALINIITLPAATYILRWMKFTSNSATIFRNFILLEIVIFIFESILIKWLFKIRYPKALLISFIANLLTAFIGVILQIFISS